MPEQLHRQIVRVRDADELASVAAQRVLACIERNPGRIAICLTGGSGPAGLFALLDKPPYATSIPWNRVHWFIGDDRFVPLSDPLSNIGTARRSFLDAHAPPECIHPIPTDLEDPDSAARSYQAALTTFYGHPVLRSDHILFDLVLMGIGPDGHTASLFPGFPEIDVRDRWCVGVPRANVAPFVSRVTLTQPALSSCREMMFLLSGEGKRAIIRRLLTDPDLPAARVCSQNSTAWLIDDAASPPELATGGRLCDGTQVQR